MHPRSRSARAPGRPDPTYGGLVAPIVPSATYARDADGGYPGGHSYSRDQNPTGEPAEALLAELEGGGEALLFASGMAAATTVLDAFAASMPGGVNGHVVAPRHMYWTVRLWLQQEAAQGRWRLTLVPDVGVDTWRAALADDPGPHLLWLETPANPMTDITDLAAVAEVGHGAGAVVVADGTTATPVHTRPLDHGVDVVFHSATKQLNGHGDVLAGALVASPPVVAGDVGGALWERVHHERGYRGAVLGSFEAWLLLRGMRTLWPRVTTSSASALAVARSLVDHPSVVEVLYPGLDAHPGHAVAARQMADGFGMLVSVRVAGGQVGARRVLGRLELFTDATSLGSTESLVEHRARLEGAGSPVPDDLLRLSVGLEHPDDLVADLHQALAGA